MKTDRPTSSFSIAALCVLVALPAHAMDGRYKLSEDAQCSVEQPEGILRIEDGILYGAESRCRMTNPLPVNGMDGALYDMVCLGEGAGWQERALVMRAATGGLILVWDGYAFEYEACPTPPERPLPRPQSTMSEVDSTSDAMVSSRPRARPSSLGD